MDKARPTQTDIARLARVTQATVSLALGNSPRLTAEVRARVQRIARELGYEPDPFLSGLSAHRKQRRSPAFQATLAWVTNWPADWPKRWRDVTTFLHYFEGAKTRAAELGYTLDEHDLAAEGMNAARLEQILKARNIPGILFAPQIHAQVKLDFRLERFSSVTFGHSLAHPRLHMVTSNHFRNTETVFRELVARGYRRPGMVLERENEMRTDRIPSSAFLTEQQNLPKSRRIPLLIAPALEKRHFLDWYHRHRPDVIISLWEQVYPWLLEDGVKVPEETALAVLSVRQLDGVIAGIWENPRLVGARALELLVDLVHRAERGVPAIPSCLLIEGTWVEGKTVRAAPRARTRGR